MFARLPELAEMIENRALDKVRRKQTLVNDAFRGSARLDEIQIELKRLLHCVPVSEVHLRAIRGGDCSNRFRKR